MGAVLYFHVGVFFITIEMLICIASQTDVNQMVYMSLTKTHVIKPLLFGVPYGYHMSEGILHHHYLLLRLFFHVF